LGVTTLQAEDEIAAICAAIGAAYAGAIGATSTSGPGLALKTEAIGLAVAVELPLVVIDVPRAGPSTGLPTKTEQADLFQALYGRSGESPVCVLAPSTPSNCFDVAFEAVRLAVKYMTPVIVLSDSTLANGAEPWRIRNLEELPDLSGNALPNATDYRPFQRFPDTLARAWVAPGTAGYEHRIGGLEKDEITGNVSYDPENHEKMCRLRAEKIARIAFDIPDAQIDIGTDSGQLVAVGWGSTYGVIHEAVQRSRTEGLDISQLHLTYINPLPRNLGKLLSKFERILVPELNEGQLTSLLRARFCLPAKTISKLQGRPFGVAELQARFRKELLS
jgi:2-oxoglutarate ferredoxin oxidoreductase subunit alpha